MSVNPAWPVAAIDLHQHLWPDGSSTGCVRAPASPYLRGWTLHTARRGAVRDRPRAPRRRGAGCGRTHETAIGLGLRVAVGAARASSRCAGRRREPLLDAGTRERPPCPTDFRGWASVRRGAATWRGRASLLDDGFVGVQVPATDVADPGGRGSVAPVLSTSPSGPGKPVLVHPGRWRRTRHAAALPAWWPASSGTPPSSRPRGGPGTRSAVRAPARLRVVFAAGAGLAPVHHERHVARGWYVGRSTRSSTSTPRRTGPRASRPWCECSASTRWCSAATGRTPRRSRELIGRRGHPGGRVTNPRRGRSACRWPSAEGVRSWPRAS